MSLPNFDEIRRLARSLPPCDPALGERVRAAIIGRRPGRQDEAAAAGWLAGAQRREPPSAAHPRIALFLAVHGVASDLEEGSTGAVAADLARLADGGGDLHRLVGSRDADLRLYELALDAPTVDSRAGPAMREDEAARAMAYGMMAIEPGLDIVVLASRGLGADIAASAIQAALSADNAGAPPAHRERIAAAAARHAAVTDPLALLAALGGPDIAAMAGAILAARLAGVAIVLDGHGAAAAGAIVKRLCDDGLAHCMTAGVDLDPPRAGLAALDLLAEACALLSA
jgi:nicotinate-nucleotide--dimethylbenzimidazole phosphoribosyltransferase